MGWEVGGRLKREGTCVYLRLIHVDVRQKPTQYCKAIILQLKINKVKKKKKRLCASNAGDMGLIPGWGTKIPNAAWWPKNTALNYNTYMGYMCVCVLSHVQLFETPDYSPPGSSIHGISQARILERVAISSSR